MNFGIMPVPVKEYELRLVTHKTSFLDAKLFFKNKKEIVFDQMLLVFQKKRNEQT